MNISRIIVASIISVLQLITLSSQVKASIFEKMGESCYEWQQVMQPLLGEQSIGNYDEYGNCVLPTLHLTDFTPRPFQKYMSLGYDLSVEKGDYDSAIINFKRALSVGKTHQEKVTAERAIIAAEIAKTAPTNNMISPYRVMYMLTGWQSVYD